MINFNRIQPRSFKLPLLIKACSIYFLVVSVYVVFSLIFFKGTVYRIYGLKANSDSLEGVVIILIFLFKGILSYGFLNAKVWSINLGILDAIIGICIYLIATSIPFVLFDPDVPNKREIGFDILFLVPYLVLLVSTKKA